MVVVGDVCWRQPTMISKAATETSRHGDQQDGLDDIDSGIGSWGRVERRTSLLVDPCPDAEVGYWTMPASMATKK